MLQARDRRRARRAPTTDWRARSRRSTAALAAPSPRRSSRSTAPSRSRWPTGPERGLALIDAIDGLDDYHLLHAARADLLRRLGRAAEARAAYRRALELVTNPVERAFLRDQLER